MKTSRAINEIHSEVFYPRQLGDKKTAGKKKKSAPVDINSYDIIPCILISCVCVCVERVIDSEGRFSSSCARRDFCFVFSVQVVVEAARRTAATAQPTPVRHGKESKVLLSTRERGTNLIGTKAAPAQARLLTSESSVMT